jgi:hypothetical protein
MSVERYEIRGNARFRDRETSYGLVQLGYKPPGLEEIKSCSIVVGRELTEQAVFEAYIGLAKKVGDRRHLEPHHLPLTTPLWLFSLWNQRSEDATCRHWEWI